MPAGSADQNANDPAGALSGLLVTAFDVAMMHSAVRWDLSNKQGRKASAAWLRSTYESLLRDAVKPEVFWELGAFEAAFSRRLQAALPKTICHAFEANPYTYDRFRDQVTATGVNYHHKALGPKDGRAMFKIGRTVGDRDLPPDMGCNSLLTKSGDRTYEDASVEMVAVDSFAATEGLLGRPSAVWIDAEGFAFQVLEGMRESLKCATFVFIEVEDRQLWEGQKTYADVRALLFAEGFIPILRDFEFKQQYNVLFCRPAVYERADVRLVLTSALQRSDATGCRAADPRHAVA
jgi:FkbM family methyltransferase